MRWTLAGLLLATIVAVPLHAADYQADLGPMPLDDETKAVIAGRGEAAARLDGTRLTLSGTFHGLPSRATAAHLLIGPAIGVPGTKALSLVVTGGTEGTVAGRYRLSAAQAAALRSGRLYVQIDSESAPPGYAWGPKGTLWGWLLPAHARATPGVPQRDAWFLPQLDTPRR
ncbi:hypothetical protein ASE95_16820 [Sphingomonas sp. Leaf231]|uniref:CHRD domain-containing protein n=1 Tax=Sphingomonas sp. Leaf231 TaxID=1736301 RepID=UPI0007010FE6|nr:CHRD domain-containing protein [Sphingomonas sp. Leaf231]KQN89832.1 hypothetical protein ASE95_16820 [Sphingomonas sp. Leaf231]